MEQLNYNTILERNQCAEKMINALKDFENNKYDKLQKRGIYIYGAPGSGKTQFAKRVLESAGYDVVKYDAGDIRNRSIIENITKANMSDRNVISMFHGKAKPIAILMDEIDGMNNGDKGGINALIKLIRPKKTKKQKLEDTTGNPIICVSNYHIDKKIKELMKVCTTIELKTPSDKQIMLLLDHYIPDMDSELKQDIIKYLHGDLRKLDGIIDILVNNNTILKSSVVRNILKPKSYNEDTKDITKRLINNKASIDEHLSTLNETDRTIVGLLWHENIVDSLNKLPKDKAFPFYLKALQHICFADYIDRVTFQKQIWQFNEMSSIIKTFYSNKVYHDFFDTNKDIQPSFYDPTEVRFTKVLTKYSTEYNNATFIQFLCHQLGMDKRDIQSFFIDMKTTTDIIDDKTMEIFENSDISKLDINRMYRYLDKCIQNSNTSVDENTILVNEIDF